MFGSQDKIHELEAENKSLRKSLAFLHQALNSANAEIAELKKVIAERDETIAAQEDSISSYRVRLEAYEEPSSRNRP